MLICLGFGACILNSKVDTSICASPRNLLGCHSREISLPVPGKLFLLPIRAENGQGNYMCLLHHVVFDYLIVHVGVSLRHKLQYQLA